jgi:hypothetical protein
MSFSIDTSLSRPLAEGVPRAEATERAREALHKLCEINQVLGVNTLPSHVWAFTMMLSVFLYNRARECGSADAVRKFEALEMRIKDDFAIAADSVDAKAVLVSYEEWLPPDAASHQETAAWREATAASPSAIPVLWKQKGRRPVFGVFLREDLRNFVREYLYPEPVEPAAAEPFELVTDENLVASAALLTRSNAPLPAMTAKMQAS